MPPPKDEESENVMLATGTGVMPMRSYIRLFFNDAADANEDGSKKFKGLTRLLMDVIYSRSLLYDCEREEYKEKYLDQFGYDYTVFRENKNVMGQKTYPQTKMPEYVEQLGELMQKRTPTSTCVWSEGNGCGHGAVLQHNREEKNGMDWEELAKSMKREHRYHVDVC